MLKLGIDVDGCLANFTDAYAKRLTFRTGIPFPKCSPEWPTTWYWDRAAGITKDQELETWQKDILESSNFWKNLDHLPQAKEVAKWLSRLINSGNEVYFITNRPGLKAKIQTEKWLYDLGMNYPTVITSSDKLCFVKGLGLDFYVDDKPETIEEIAAAALPNLRLYLRLWKYNTHRECPDCKLAANRNCFRCGGTKLIPRTYPANVLYCESVLGALQESYGK